MTFNPMIINYGSPVTLGSLAALAGSRNSQWQAYEARQRQANINAQMELERERSAMNLAATLQGVYAKRDQKESKGRESGATKAQAKLEADSQKAEQSLALIDQMMSAGHIDAPTAARMKLGVTSGSPSLAGLGNRGSESGMSEYQNNKFLVEAADVELKNARDGLNAFINGTPGGLVAIQSNPALKSQYDVLARQVAEANSRAVQIRREAASGRMQAPGSEQQVSPGQPAMVVPQTQAVQSQGAMSSMPQISRLPIINGVPLVANESDLIQIPPGGQFMAPDGTIRVKPGSSTAGAGTASGSRASREGMEWMAGELDRRKSFSLPDVTKTGSGGARSSAVNPKSPEAVEKGILNHFVENIGRSGGSWFMR